MSVLNALDIEAQVTALQRVATKLQQYEVTSTDTHGRVDETAQAHLTSAKQLIEAAIFALQNPAAFVEPVAAAESEPDGGIAVPTGDGFADEPSDNEDAAAE